MNRDKLAGVAQHAVRVAVIGGRVRMRELGDAADPEPVLHGHDRGAPVGGSRSISVTRKPAR